MDSVQLKFLTLNCWGLPDLITGVVYNKCKDPNVLQGRKWDKRSNRILEISKSLDSYDIICLQEVWIQKDREMLISICKEKGIKHSHVFTSGLLGSSGLVLLSRFPIKEVQFHKYRKNGHAFRVDHGDFHVGKGIAFAKIAIADNQNINVLFTHTIAGYSKEDQYLPDRVSQVWEIVRFLKNYSKDEPMFLCGDMNCNPDSIEYNILKYHGKLVDSYKEHNQKGADGKKDLGLTLLTGPERLDYVFFRKSDNIRLLHSKVVLNDPSFLYSDHFGVTSTFSISSGSHAQKQNKGKNSLTNEMKKGASEEEEEVEDDSNHHLERSIVEQSTGIVHHGRLQAEKRKINHFIRAASLLFVIYLLASLNAPHLFIIAATIFFALDIITGLFFVGCEVTALNQIHEELRYLSK